MSLYRKYCKAQLAFHVRQESEKIARYTGNAEGLSVNK